MNYLIVIGIVAALAVAMVFAAIVEMAGDFCDDITFRGER